MVHSAHYAKQKVVSTLTASLVPRCTKQAHTLCRTHCAKQQSISTFAGRLVPSGTQQAPSIELPTQRSVSVDRTTQHAKQQAGVTLLADLVPRGTQQVAALALNMQSSRCSKQLLFKLNQQLPSMPCVKRNTTSGAHTTHRAKQQYTNAFLACLETSSTQPTPALGHTVQSRIHSASAQHSALSLHPLRQAAVNQRPSMVHTVQQQLSSPLLSTAT